MSYISQLSCSTSYLLLCTILEVKLHNSAILFPKWLRESNITFQVCHFAKAVGNREHPKNCGNGNHNYYYHLHLLLPFSYFMVEFAMK